MDPLFVSVTEFGRLFSISKSKANEAPPQTDKACPGEQAVRGLTEGLRSRATGGIGKIAPGMMTGERSDGR